jgi:hypothetical protein
MLVPGQNYKLTFMYGFLKTYAWRPPNIGKFEVFNTKAVAGIRCVGNAAPSCPCMVDHAVGHRLRRCVTCTAASHLVWC